MGICNNDGERTQHQVLGTTMNRWPRYTLYDDNDKVVLITTYKEIYNEYKKRNAKAEDMIRLTKFIDEGVKLKLIRGKDQDVLKMWNKGDRKWVELRRKPGFERKYDPKDPLHRAITALGKSASISDFVNGTEVSINPKHPDGKRALDTINKLMDEHAIR